MAEYWEALPLPVAEHGKTSATFTYTALALDPVTAAIKAGDIETTRFWIGHVVAKLEDVPPEFLARKRGLLDCWVQLAAALARCTGEHQDGEVFKRMTRLYLRAIGVPTP